MATISFTDATEQLQIYLSSRGRSTNTLKAYLTDVKMFWQEMALTEISPLELESLAAAWLNTRRRIISPKTTGRRLTSMKSLGLAFKQVVLADYSAPTPARPKPHPLPGGVDDLRKLLDVCHQDEHRALIALTGLCGARISEARDVKPTDFDFAHRTLEIWGKGDKIRTVPVSDMAWEILLPLLVARITEQRGGRQLISIGDRAARDLITRLGERASLARAISSHDLRATFATEAFRKTKDILAVQQLLGHATSKQTELYILISDDAMRAAADFMEDK